MSDTTIDTTNFINGYELVVGLKHARSDPGVDDFKRFARHSALGRRLNIFDVIALFGIAACALHQTQ